MQSSVDQVWIEVLKLHTAAALYMHVSITLYIHAKLCSSNFSIQTWNVYMYIYLSKLFLPPNPPLKQFEAQRLSVCTEVLIFGTVPCGQSWRGLLSPMRKSSPRRHPMRLPSFQGWWSWERLIGVSLPCRGKTAFPIQCQLHRGWLGA